MQKLLKFKLLIMIALLSYSTSWCQSNVLLSSTGGFTVKSDSVLIAYNDLRKVNAKLVELKYEKEINDSLRSIISNDEIVIREYKCNFDSLKKQIKKENRKYKIAVGGGLFATLSMVVMLIVK